MRVNWEEKRMSIECHQSFVIGCNMGLEKKWA